MENNKDGNLEYNDFFTTLEYDDETSEENEYYYEFLELFNKQIKNLENLKINYLVEYGFITYDLMKYFLEYVDMNIVKIPNLFNILNEENRTVNIGMIIYEILYIDLLDKYIDLLLLKLNIKTPEELINFEYEEIRDVFNDIFEEINELSSDNGIADSLSSKYEFFKVSILNELLNNDIEDFIEFIINCIVKINDDSINDNIQ